MSEIRFIQRKDINTDLWDLCIDQSQNAYIYGYSWYLDAITDGQWAAVIYGNYEAVFPLPWRKKYLISYIYQPFFCQQLGLFAPVDFKLTQDEFIHAIPKQFKKVHLQLNSHFPLTLQAVSKPNYMLHLGSNYATLKLHFKSDALKNLKKSEKLQLTFKEDLSPESIMALYQPVWGELNQHVKMKDNKRFIDACNKANEKGRYIGLGVCLNEELLGAGIFLVSNKRIHYLVSGPTEAGRKLSIMHRVLEYVIRKYAGQDLILDFEGSSIPDVAKFYEKWGSQKEFYWEILVRQVFG
jgi:Acetyltransferase (GNAT) domain